MNQYLKSVIKKKTVEGKTYLLIFYSFLCLNLSDWETEEDTGQRQQEEAATVSANEQILH